MPHTKDHTPRQPMGHLPIPERKRRKDQAQPVPPFPPIEEAYVITGRKAPVTIDREPGDAYVVQTNPCCEERATENIWRAGFAVFDPKRTHWEVLDRRNGRHRPVRRKARLIPGYLFVELPKFEPPLGRVRDCEGVWDFVYQDRRPGIVPAKTLAELRVLEHEGAFDETVPQGFSWVSPGACGIVGSGPLKGFSGTIDRVDMDAFLVWVSVHLLGTRTALPPLKLDELVQA